MKKTILKILIGIILVPVLAYTGYLGYLAYLAPESPATAATPEPIVVETGPEVVSAEGKVVPAQYVQLSFKAPGLVEEVLVAPGDQVEKGELIARLEGQEQLKAMITTARLELISAEQSRDELYDHLALRRALAQQAVVDAQDAADQAERTLNSLTRSASSQQVETAESAVALAEKELEKAEKNLKSFSNRSQADPERAAAQLAFFAAQRQYQTAVRYLNALKGEPSNSDIARAEANLAVAQAQLDEAEREYEILQKGPYPNEVALAEARVESAADQLAAAEASLKDLELAAPFSGEIITLNLKVGEVANPGAPGAILADLSSWQVKTIDLPENDVSIIAPGMEANIGLNAFPGRTFTGRVKEIDRQGVESRGTVTYAVTLDIDPKDTTLSWGMSAFVEIFLP